jgi:3-isopropylmalate/(R)-2-methylmalate dehydratase small subunit
MRPIKIINSKVTPIDMANVDTDQIIPKQFLKLVQRSGFGKFLFYNWRFDELGNERPDFVLNNERYKGREILLSRANFGCGSSREHAVWAIADFGFRALISSSFADIFYNNCLKNGILPLILGETDIEYLFKVSEREEVQINLQRQEVSFSHRILHFQIDDTNKRKLLEGLDDIAITLKMEDKIIEYEQKMSSSTTSV